MAHRTTDLALPNDDSANVASLASLEEATQLLARVHNLDDVKGIIDKASAARVYARQARLGLEAQNHAAEIKLRAERRAGQLLRELELRPGNPQLSHRATIVDERDVAEDDGLPVALPADESAQPPKLSELGITRSQSSRWQQIADVPAAEFEDHIQQTRKRNQEITTSSMLKLAPRPAYVPPEAPAIDWQRLGPADRFTVSDALDLPSEWEPRSVNLWVTSPPYALDIPYEGGDVPSYEVWLQRMLVWLRVMYDLTAVSGRLCLNVPLDRDQGGWDPVSADVISLACRETGWRFRTWIIWDEGNAGEGTGRGSVDSASAPNVTAPVESVIVFYRDEWKREGPVAMPHNFWLERCGPRGVWRFSGARGNELVPVPFPEELAYRAIQLFSFPEDVVADPFCGLGTTGAVAARLGRVAWMADRNPRCIEAARGWVARERASVAA